MLCAMGLNGMCPDDVNTYQSGGLKNYTCLEASNLVNEKVFADLIGTYGIKYYLSVCYASPLAGDTDHYLCQCLPRFHDDRCKKVVVQ